MRREEELARLRASRQHLDDRGGEWMEHWLRWTDPQASREAKDAAYAQLQAMQRLVDQHKAHYQTLASANHPQIG